MTGLLLTSNRRAELTALLADEQRLAAEYPTVADYLRTAPQLSGTGDDEADAAFDLRMLHFLTGGASDNPYWDIVAPGVRCAPPERRGRREVNGGRPTGSVRMAYAQTVLQAAYAYAIPSPQTVSWVARICAGRRVVEIGAGRGYWAHLLTDRGGEVLAIDAEPPQHTQNPSFPSAPGQPKIWHPVLGSAEAAVGAADVLLLCWPPAWGNSMASEALAAFGAAGGRDLIYVGEHRGGKTADGAFFDLLTTRWRPADRDPDFVSWWNMSDTAQYWTARR